MKKVLFIILLFGFGVNSNAQEFKGNISGTIGLINFKTKIQYEIPVGDNLSTGANLNYYFVNWTGPLIEPFIRIYGKKYGNTEGWFLQGKLGYGNLKNLDDYFISGATKSERFSTFGGGVAVGNKIFLSDKITLEPIIGLRIYTAPSINQDIYDSYAAAEALGEDIGWALTTGLPLDLQVKVGYQF